MKLLRILLLSFILMTSLMIVAQEETSDYRNPDLPIEQRVEDLLSQMTLEEKIGQMTLVEVDSIDPVAAGEFLVGGVLSGGGGFPSPNTPEAWATRTNDFQENALNTRLSIPIIYGVDAIHGHNNVLDAVIYPHNIGLGATHNPTLVEQIGRATACDMVATGIYWNYAPVVAVPQDIRWGRTYEAYGQDTALVTELSLAFLRGLQGDDISDPYTAVGTPKHYIADGGAIWGTSATGDYAIDQGDAIISEEELRAIHLPPYTEAVNNGARVIMASFSSWNGVKMHEEAYLLTDVLRDELGFTGFVVSDWAGIDQIDPDYYVASVAAVNAGVDMNMVPYDYQLWIRTVNEAVENGDISMARIDEAVSNILRVKFELGLFEQPLHNADALNSFSNQSYRDLARQAVSQSLVLLQNENDALPLSAENIDTIYVAGNAADDIGIQAGGWTISWQGSSGNITDGTTILDAIEASMSEETDLFFNRFGRYNRANDDDGNPIQGDVGIVVVGESPYAEGQGDSNDLTLSEGDINAITNVRERVDKLIVIVVSGRPLIITEQLDIADAWVMAWLPGSEGAGVTDVLFGDVPFTGRLSFHYPRSMAQIPLSALLEDDTSPLFPIGHGITTGTLDDYDPIDIICGAEQSADTNSETDILFIPDSPDTAINGWELVWNDEFDGDAIDRTNWGFDTGGTGFGNNELQYYTDDPENAFVEDGNLVIQALNERTLGMDYSSAKLWTLALHQWQYGRFDIRARMPEGQGIWPAFWMLPLFSDYGGWPHGGEIDIMEYLGHEQDTVHGTLHYSDEDGHQYTGTSYTLNEGTFSDDFHVFTVIWEEGRIQWFVDGELYQTQSDWQTRNADYPAPFDQEFYLMLNLAIGGNWPGSPDETTVFPQRLLVDYVRVYQEAE